MNSSIFPHRLKNARIMKGFSMDDLCSAMGNPVSKMTISKYENGQLAPNSTILIALAKALEQPLDYFFRPFSVQIDSIRFRKKSSLPAKKEQSLRETIADLVERYIDIEEICNETKDIRTLPKERASSKEEVLQAVSLIRSQWGLGTDGIVNVIDLLEKHGVKVLEIDAPDSFDGMCSMVNDVFYVIILNRSFPAERKRFTALHELGHLVLKFSGEIDHRTEESLCHLFASEMLLPEQELRNIVGNFRKDIMYQELRAIQMHYGISCDAIMHKAMDCGIISTQRYRFFRIQKNRNSKFKALVEKSLYKQESSERFIRLVYKALSQELITLSKAAGLLHQSVDQIREELSPI